MILGEEERLSETKLLLTIQSNYAWCEPGQGVVRIDTDKVSWKEKRLNRIGKAESAGRER